MLITLLTRGNADMTLILAVSKILMYIMKYSAKAGGMIDDSKFDELLKDNSSSSIYQMHLKYRYEEARQKKLCNHDLAQIALGNKVFKSNIKVFTCDIDIYKYKANELGEQKTDSVRK